MVRFKLSIFSLAFMQGIAIAPYTACSQPAVRADEIRIVVHKVHSRNGSVICSLWASAQAQQFTKVGTALRKTSAPIQSDQAICEFEDLPADFYAATVFHDENGDGRFNFFPLEGHGLSNNVRPYVWPEFDPSKFYYSGKGVLTIEIDLNYHWH